MVDHLRQKLEMHQQELRQFVRAYNEKWLELFRTELEARELGYCSRCGKIAPMRALSLLFFEGFAHEKGTDVSELHRMCGDCGEALKKMGDGAARLDPQNPFCVVCDVEVIDGKMFANKHGTRVRLPPHTTPLRPLELMRIKELMREWRHPLRLSLDFANERLSFEE